MRFSKFFRAESQKSELDEEIAAHLAMAAADNQDRGTDAVTAQQEAQREFGNTALIKDVTRQTWGWLWLERLQQDLKYALRQMRKSPGFAASVIGTLALGIAAATAMFTVVDRVLLRSLPYPHPSRLVELHEASDGHKAQYTTSPYLDIAAWRDQARSFESIAFYSSNWGHNFLEGNTATTQVQLMRVSGNLFQTLGVTPQLGPGLKNLPESFATTGATHTIVLSDVAWHTLFDADRNIIGKTVQMNGESYTVVGVMPHGFFFPADSAADSESPQVWAPVAREAKDRQRTHSSTSYRVIARLKNGTKLAQASGEMQVIQARAAQGYSDPEWRASHSHVRLEQLGASDVSETTTHALLALTGRCRTPMAYSLHERDESVVGTRFSTSAGDSNARRFGSNSQQADTAIDDRGTGTEQYLSSLRSAAGNRSNKILPTHVATELAALNAGRSKFHGADCSRRANRNFRHNVFLMAGSPRRTFSN